MSNCEIYRLAVLMGDRVQIEHGDDSGSLENKIALIYVQRKDNALLAASAMEELAIERGVIARDLGGLKLVGIGPLVYNEDSFFFKAAVTLNRDDDHTEAAYFCQGCSYWIIGGPEERLSTDEKNKIQKLFYWCRICGHKVGEAII